MNQHDTRVSQRGSIIALHEEGLSTLGISQRTVLKWIHLWQEKGRLTDLERRPRSRVTSVDEDEDLLQAAERMLFKPATEVREAVGLQVSMTTVRRRVHAAGNHHRAPAKKERLTDAHRAARLAFAQEYAAKDMEFWERTVFTDKKTFNSCSHGRIHLWRRNNTRDHTAAMGVVFGGEALNKTISLSKIVSRSKTV
ncbi:hypothetical protein Pcinc_013305 [Petrolisthes cinctipes]|uniref:Transposase Tc1-like domain-containing protein n=1 Tax=Petrolisthes cinctipes TaxID=88211 RepID=A0AAE1FX73_PETCI|nr:hypothetical protein Pcinc_013305 [Petrolisthes cinctipes]